MSSNPKNREFMEGIFELASSFIRERLQRLPLIEQKEVRQFAVRVLEEPELKKNEKLRNGAVRLIIALLPDTLPLLKKLLADWTSPFWYEVQFTIFCALERDDLQPEDQVRVLQLVHDYLLAVPSDAGAAAWKAGDLLGDEWRDSDTIKILETLLFSARHAPGRKAALHGIEHALNKSSRSDRQRLFSLIRKAAQEDRSADVRRSAQQALRGVGCGPPPGESEQ